MAAGKTNKRGFIVYEESLPLEKLKGFLVAHHYSAVISPLHDSDVWTAEDCEKWRETKRQLHGCGPIPDGVTEWEFPTGEVKRGNYGQPVPVMETVKVPQVGEVKKAHRHVYIEFDYSMTLKSALEIFRPLGIVYLEPIRSRSAYLRYLCHLDDDDKAQYDINDVIAVGGCDISPLFVLTDVQKTLVVFSVMDHIAENRIHSFTRLLDTLRDEKMIAEFNEAKRNWGMWREYIRMKTFVYTVGGVDFDAETGEPMTPDGEFPHDPVEQGEEVLQIA